MTNEIFYNIYRVSNNEVVVENLSESKAKIFVKNLEKDFPDEQFFILKLQEEEIYRTKKRGKK